MKRRLFIKLMGLLTFHSAIWHYLKEWKLKLPEIDECSNASNVRRICCKDTKDFEME